MGKVVGLTKELVKERKKANADKAKADKASAAKESAEKTDSVKAE